MNAVCDMLATILYNERRVFFQAEDGIRDLYVTGVQTCALPISRERKLRGLDSAGGAAQGTARKGICFFFFKRKSRSKKGERGKQNDRKTAHHLGRITARSEERRVGKESRSRTPT